MPAGIVAAVVGAEVAHLLPGGGHPLMVITAVLLLWSGIRLVRDRPEDDARPVPAISRRLHATVTTGVGSMAGLLSGLLGVGGGVVMVPAFKSLLDLPIKRAIATSLSAWAASPSPAP